MMLGCKGLFLFSVIEIHIKLTFVFKIVLRKLTKRLGKTVEKLSFLLPFEFMEFSFYQRNLIFQ